MSTIEFQNNFTKLNTACKKCNKTTLKTNLYCLACSYPANYDLIRKTINSLNLRSKSMKEANGIKKTLIFIGFSEVFIGIINLGTLFHLLIFIFIGLAFIGLSFRSNKEPLLMINIGVVLYILAVLSSFTLYLIMPYIPFVLHLIILPLMINCYSKFKKYNKAVNKLKKLQYLN